MYLNLVRIRNAYTFESLEGVLPEICVGNDGFKVSLSGVGYTHAYVEWKPP